ncbi:MAG: hypothetical protein WCH32_14330 [Pseudomonadota bacterium]
MTAPLHEPRPELYEQLLARFALRPRDRLLGRFLVGLARIPGAVRLLTGWHAWRARE